MSSTTAFLPLGFAFTFSPTNKGFSIALKNFLVFALSNLSFFKYSFLKLSLIISASFICSFINLISGLSFVYDKSFFKSSTLSYKFL